VLSLLRPAADRLEHFTVNLVTIVTDSRVVEGLENIIDDLIDRNTRILPGVENAAVETGEWK
jgi:hypothetical protein